jgi:thiamine biosynthesis lipoprotein
MACEFSVILNPGNRDSLQPAGDVLELIHEIESWLSVYRATSLISMVNRQAAAEAVHVQRPLFDVLQKSVELHQQTGGAFDVATGALIGLWRQCRSEQRVPEPAEVEQVLASCGSQHLLLDESTVSVRFAADGLQLDPGAIGKGYALDQSCNWLQATDGAPDSFLLHGGHSSLLARGKHNGLSGWPVGIGNPLLTQKRLGTVLLKNQAMSTSGSNIQFFRHQGQRYGHILDPTTGWPVEGMLSVTVLADSAAVADALSTAFFVLGVENALKCCDNLENVGAILIPFPEGGKRVTPVVMGVPPEQIFWDQDQVVTS